MAKLSANRAPDLSRATDLAKVFVVLFPRVHANQAHPNII
jgi:hypothetical protein